jgi:hypothetical protein
LKLSNQRYHQHFTTFPSNNTQQQQQEQPITIRRDNEFYEKWAKKRVYFYQVDLRGRLFLDSPNLLRRNDATCLKSKEFLDFFFTRIVHCQDESIAQKCEKFPIWKEAIRLFTQEYPWISPCGKELNLIKAEDTPIVFKDLVPSLKHPEEEEDLLYGGNLREQFKPERLFVGKQTERVYYTRESGIEYGLIHADLAQRFSKGFVPEGDNPFWEYRNHKYPLRFM